MTYVFMLWILLFNHLFGEYTSSNYPVDVCFLIADLKYSESSGIKICEIQNGSVSVFKGDSHAHGGIGTIPANFIQALAKFHLPCWAIPTRVADKGIMTLMKNSENWTLRPSLLSILKSPAFKDQSEGYIEDPYDIASYHGLVLDRPRQLGDYQKFIKSHPGIITLDASSFALWTDKYKMSLLFLDDKDLETIKPKWKLYTKKYTPLLAEQISSDLGNCPIFVIKPRGAFLGKGVIIVAREQLDETLKYIFKSNPEIIKDSDPSYNYWLRDTYDTFLVEEFILSDPIQVKELENKWFQGTMRVAFLLVYNKKEFHVDFLGGYWSLPSRSLDEPGSLNDKHKACCKLPYYTQIGDETLLKVEKELKPFLPIFHKKMLESYIQ